MIFRKFPIRRNTLYGISFCLHFILALLAYGVQEVAFINKLFTGVNILVIVFVTIAGFVKADFHNWALSEQEVLELVQNRTNMNDTNIQCLDITHRNVESFYLNGIKEMVKQIFSKMENFAKIKKFCRNRKLCQKSKTIFQKKIRKIEKIFKNREFCHKIEKISRIEKNFKNRKKFQKSKKISIIENFVKNRKIFKNRKLVKKSKMFSTIFKHR